VDTAVLRIKKGVNNDRLVRGRWDADDGRALCALQGSGTKTTLAHHAPCATLGNLHVRVTRELTETFLHSHMRVAARRLAAALRAQRALLLGPR
jgi:hypothetical protein